MPCPPNEVYQLHPTSSPCSTWSDTLRKTRDFPWYTPTGEEWHICSFNAQPEAPAFFVAGPGQAGASGWALNESFSTGSGITHAREWFLTKG